MSKKKLCALKWTFIIMEWVSMFMPLFIIVCIRWDRYFSSNKSSISVGIGMAMLISTIVLLVMSNAKKFKVHKIVWASLIFGICAFLQTVLNDAFYLSLGYLIGCVLFEGLDIPKRYFEHRHQVWQDTGDVLDAREEKREQRRQKRVSKENMEEDNFGQL